MKIRIQTPKHAYITATQFILFLQLIFTPVVAICGQITLAWTQNTESDIAGYRVFCRDENSSHTFSNPLWEGTNTTLTINDLEDNKGYYFIVRAFTSSGIESLNSNEVYFYSQADTTAENDTDTESDQDDIVAENDSNSDADDTTSENPQDDINDGTEIEIQGSEVAVLDVGQQYYLDRSYVITSIPSSLNTGSEKWIKTKNDDKYNSSNSYLTFTISRDSVVYVAYDSRTSQLPSWLASAYTATGLKIGVSEEMEHFAVYQKTFAAGTTVVMGGNMAAGAKGATSNYIVIIQPAESYEELLFSTDTLIFNIDENTGTISRSIELYATNNDVVPFHANDDATWLSVTPEIDSTPATLLVSVDATGLSPGKYTANIAATADGYYSAVCQVSVTMLDSSAPLVELHAPINYEIDELVLRKVYYLDRSYQITSIPAELLTGSEKLVKTCNNDKFVTSDSFLSFTISRDSTVYVGYDSTATTLPDWLANNFAATDMTITVSEEMEYFNVYKMTFKAGSTITLGGNMAVGAQGAESNYIVIIQSTEDTPGLVFSQDRLSFNADENNGTWTQNIELRTTNGDATFYRIRDDAEWLKVTPESGPTPAEVSVSVDATGLSPGKYTATVTAVADGHYSGIIKAGLTVSESGNQLVEILSTSENGISLSLKDGKHLTVELSDGTVISGLEIKEAPSELEDQFNDLDFTYGLIDFTIEDFDSNGNASVIFRFPEGSNPEAYYKYGPSPDNPENHWYEFTYDGETGAIIDGNVVTLYFVDGKRGDDNLQTADDKISDTTGGAVFRSSQALQSASTESTGSSSGCFLQCISQ